MKLELEREQRGNINLVGERVGDRHTDRGREVAGRGMLVIAAALLVWMDGIVGQGLQWSRSSVSQEARLEFSYLATNGKELEPGRREKSASN